MSYDIDKMSQISGLAGCDLIGSGEGESRVATIACVRSITAEDSDLYELPRSCFHSFSIASDYTLTAVAWLVGVIWNA
ncbi:MAG: hypothetical protein VYA84_04675 [Planctomycetota bacterium]|nr:hypothetical protein [Planctomycetota bacterium]